MNYLLDTCVVSELVVHHPDPLVVEWLRAQDPESLFLSALTVGEIEKGIAKRGGDYRARQLSNWLHSEIMGSFGDRILPVGKKVSIEWGRICGSAEKAGRKRPAIDSLIAATASVHGLMIATRNVDDMAGMGVPVFNPFSE